MTDSQEVAQAEEVVHVTYERSWPASCMDEVVQTDEFVFNNILVRPSSSKGDGMFIQENVYCIL